MKHEPKKHFDVSKPRRHGPDPTSKPIIVGHHPTMPDPMIREERNKTAKPIKVILDGEKPEPVVEEPTPKPELKDISATQETSPALTPSPPPPEVPESPVSPPAPEPQPFTAASPADSTPESVPVDSAPTPESIPSVTPTAEPATHQSHPEVDKSPEPATPSEPPPGQELHIPAGHTAVHHKPRIWVWTLFLIIILIWAYAAVDALTDIKLPYEFFESQQDQLDDIPV